MQYLGGLYMPHVQGAEGQKEAGICESRDGGWEVATREGRLPAEDGRGAAKQWRFGPLWKQKARKNSLLEPQGDMLSCFPRLLSQTLRSHSAGSGESSVKVLADLPSIEVSLLVHEWCLSVMSSLGGHGRESFGASFIKAPRDEGSSEPDISKGPHGSVPSPWQGGLTYATGKTHAICLVALGF